MLQRRLLFLEKCWTAGISMNGILELQVTQEAVCAASNVKKPLEFWETNMLLKNSSSGDVLLRSAFYY